MIQARNMQEVSDAVGETVWLAVAEGLAVLLRVGLQLALSVAVHVRL